MGYEYFEVVISDVRLTALTRNNDSSQHSWSLKHHQKLFLKLAWDGYKTVYTAPSTYPWAWKGSIQKFYYHTHWQLKDKVMLIQCMKERRIRDDKHVARAELSIGVIAEGPNSYELPMINDDDQTVCMVKLHVHMTQVIKDVTLRMSQIDITDAYHKLLPVFQRRDVASTLLQQQAQDQIVPPFAINVSLGYMDPHRQQWQETDTGSAVHYPLHLDSIQTDGLVVIPELKVKLGQKSSFSAKDFVAGCLHLDFWTFNEDGTSETKEYGRVLLPIMGLYDQDQPRCEVHSLIMWNDRVVNAEGISASTNNVAEQDYMHANLAMFNGPKHMQMTTGSCVGGERGVISGTQLLGFLPPPQDVFEIDVHYHNVPRFVYQNILHNTSTNGAGTTNVIDEEKIGSRRVSRTTATREQEDYAGTLIHQLKLKGYINFPQWFMCREPSTQLSMKYNYQQLKDPQDDQHDLQSLHFDSHEEDEDDVLGELVITGNSQLKDDDPQGTALITTNQLNVIRLRLRQLMFMSSAQNREWLQQHQSLATEYTGQNLTLNVYYHACCRLNNEHTTHQWNIRTEARMCIREYYQLSSNATCR